MKAIIKELRIDHYIKNIVIFIPFILNHKLLSITNLVDIILLFISFCCIASTVYILNDLKDKEVDLLNPYKKLRPIAQGLLSTKQILLLIIICFTISFSISIYLNTAQFVFGYLILNIIYSYLLKIFFVIDAFCIALGFVLRILASFYLLNIPINTEIIFWIFTTSTFFTFIKRKLELSSLNYRTSLKKITPNKINTYILLSLFLSILFYERIIFNYTNLTIFFIITAFYITILFRILFLSNQNNNFDDPINFIKKDIFLKILLSLFLLTLFYTTYI